MGIPWTSHGDFIWAKTHGKLMEYFHDISMGHFYKGPHGNNAQQSFTATQSHLNCHNSLLKVCTDWKLYVDGHFKNFPMCMHLKEE